MPDGCRGGTVFLGKTMRRRPVTLFSATKKNRHDALAIINDVILSAGGWIISHTLFSNIAAAFRFELPANSLAPMQRRLEEQGIRLDANSQKAISQLDPAPGTEDIVATLSITFIHDEPDLRHQIPAIPG